MIRSLLVVVGRFVLLTLALVGFVLAHSPYCYPTYLLALMSVNMAWREPFASTGASVIFVEAIALGGLVAFLITPFYQGLIEAYAGEIYVICCFLYSLPFFAIGLTHRLTRKWSTFAAAPAIAVVSTICELIQTSVMEITWITGNSVLAIANTPIAQWIVVLSPFGLSFLLAYLGCLLTPNLSNHGWHRWRSSYWGLGCVLTLWIGGWFLELRTPVQPLTCSALMVQPQGSETCREYVTALRDLTQRSLADVEQVDLVVWPENSIAVTDMQQADGRANVNLECNNIQTKYTAKQLRSDLYGIARCNWLVGVVRTQMVEQPEYSMQPFAEEERYNTGCLISTAGQIDWHEKLVLVPVQEVVPRRLNRRFLNWLFPGLYLNTSYRPGRNFKTLSYPDISGTTRRIAVAICYESWLPWLPQYHCKEPLDAVCHLAYDGDFKDHPEYTQRMLLSIRLRAIETRTWQLVCSHYAGTAVIDPRGRIVKQLPPGPGVLRTDQLE